MRVGDHRRLASPVSARMLRLSLSLSLSVIQGGGVGRQSLVYGDESEGVIVVLLVFVSAGVNNGVVITGK